jgi:hypothetical protein
MVIGFYKVLSFFFLTYVFSWRAPKLPNRFKCGSEVKTVKEQKVGARSLARNTLRGRGAC